MYSPQSNLDYLGKDERAGCKECIHFCTEAELVELHALDALDPEKIRRLFVRTDSSPADVAPTNK